MAKTKHSTNLPDSQTTQFFHALAGAMVANYKPLPAPARKRVTLSARSWRKALQLLSKPHETLSLMPDGSGALLYSEPNDVRLSRNLIADLVFEGWITNSKIDPQFYVVTELGRREGAK